MMLLRLLRHAALEYMLFDSRLVGQAVGVVGMYVAALLLRLGRHSLGFAVLAKLHRSAYSELASRRALVIVRQGTSLQTRAPQDPVQRALRAFVSETKPTAQIRHLFDDPGRLLSGNALVLKSPRPNERGVLYLYYSYTYQIFARSFDVAAITDRYYLALEPSWSGYCDPQILLFTQWREPVFVGAREPRDRDFIEQLGSNLVAAPYSSNTWVDHREFFPDASIEKDLDVVMVSGWGWYKRHWAVFRALRALRRRGRRLKVALVGYQLDMRRDEIEEQAAFFGVRDQLEFYERQNRAAVNRLYNRARVNLLWSRREGVNRSIIEGMFAGTPCILREGFNYGFWYPHINAATGTYATEASLADTLVDVIDRHAEYSPRDWVLDHMSCQRTTALLNDTIRATALARGESWSQDIVVKTSDLDGLLYWHPEDADRFADDRAFIRAHVLDKSRDAV